MGFLKLGANANSAPCPSQCMHSENVAQCIETPCPLHQCAVRAHNVNITQHCTVTSKQLLGHKFNLDLRGGTARTVCTPHLHCECLITLQRPVVGNKTALLDNRSNEHRTTTSNHLTNVELRQNSNILIRRFVCVTFCPMLFPCAIPTGVHVALKNIGHNHRT